MGKPLTRRIVPIWLAGLVLSGCVAAPPEKPIVLRRTSPTRAQRAAASRAASVRNASRLPPAERDEGVLEPADLTPAGKDALFRDFDQYLAHNPPPP